MSYRSIKWNSIAWLYLALAIAAPTCRCLPRRTPTLHAERAIIQVRPSIIDIGLPPHERDTGVRGRIAT